MSQPLGYAMTYSAGGGLGGDPTPDHRRFTVHRIDKPVASGPSFGSADEIHEYHDDEIRAAIMSAVATD
jgi:hypothetical protein